MELSIHERDVTPDLCMQCGACCRILLTLEHTDRRYRTFLRETGFALSSVPRAGDTDCCDDMHSIQVDTGFCRHLKRAESEGGVKCSCTIYETASFPKLCAEFNCVSWAKARNQYGPQSSLLMSAQAALDRMRAERSRIRIVDGQIVD